MNILYCCDDKFCPYTGISITSLFINNSDLDEINVYVLGLEISDKNKQKFEMLAQKYNRTITIINAEPIDKFLSDQNVKLWKGNRTAWYRLFFEQIMPNDIDRLLYLDSDTIIVGDLSELQNFNFKQNKAAAMMNIPVLKGYKQHLGLSKHDLYYSSGVLLIEMESWKYLKCSERLIYAIKKGYSYFIYPEQDLINAVLRDNIAELPFRFNIVSVWINKSVGDNQYELNKTEMICRENPITQEQVDIAMRNPVILHTVNGSHGVPWKIGNTNPFSNEWHKYREMSLWYDTPAIEAAPTTAWKDRTLFQRIHRITQIVVEKALLPKFVKELIKCAGYRIGMISHIRSNRKYYRKYGSYPRSR